MGNVAQVKQNFTKKEKGLCRGIVILVDHVFSTMLRSFTRACRPPRTIIIPQLVDGPLNCTDRSSDALQFVEAIHKRLIVGLDHLEKLDAKKKQVKTLLHIYGDTAKTVKSLSEGALMSRFSGTDKERLRKALNDVKLRHALSAVETLFDFSCENALDDEATKTVDRILRNHFDFILICDHFYDLADEKKADKIVDKGAVIKIKSPITVVEMIESVRDELVFSFSVDFPDHPNLGIDIALSEEMVYFDSGRDSCCIVPSSVRYTLSECLKNAVSATMKRADGVFTKPFVTLSSSDGLAIRVVDDGVGLEENSGKDLFQFGHVGKIRYDRLNHQTSYAAVRDPLQGIGVGLPISKILMEQAGGGLTVQNRPGGGGVEAKILLQQY